MNEQRLFGRTQELGKVWRRLCGPKGIRRHRWDMREIVWARFFMPISRPTLGLEQEREKSMVPVAEKMTPSLTFGASWVPQNMLNSQCRNWGSEFSSSGFLCTSSKLTFRSLRYQGNDDYWALCTPDTGVALSGQDVAEVYGYRDWTQGLIYAKKKKKKNNLHSTELQSWSRCHLNPT